MAEGYGAICRVGILGSQASMTEGVMDHSYDLGQPTMVTGVRMKWDGTKLDVHLLLPDDKGMISNGQVLVFDIQATFQHDELWKERARWMESLIQIFGKPRVREMIQEMRVTTSLSGKTKDSWWPISPAFEKMLEKL